MGMEPIYIGLRDLIPSQQWNAYVGAEKPM
jgi:hypothetical protein